MSRKIPRMLMGSTAIGLVAFAAPAAASAARHHSHRSHPVHATQARGGDSSGSTSASSAGAETTLTGTALSSASAAALAAVPGGTVDGATTEADGTGAYEVIVTRSDGTRVKVIEDASFTVLSSTTTSCR